MPFYKTSKTTILAVKEDISSSLNMSKYASVQKVASYYNQDPPKADDIAEKLKAVAETYCISSDPKDYVYVAVRALTADVPNENHDAFSEKELLRFDSKFGCKVYQTFNMKPHHVNHRSADPKQARGVILDSHYNTKNAEHFPEILIAVDKTKDHKLAEGIASGDISGFSMGCTADWTICSVCDHTASSPAEFCNHIRFHKGKEINGKVAFELCEGVCFEEESSVDDPADKNALTQEVILASSDSKKEQVHLETELLTINSKLNKVLDKISEKEDTNMAVKKASSKKVSHDSKGTDFEKYKEDKKHKDEKQMTGGEYGILPDVEEHSKGVENIAGTEEAPKDASTEDPKDASKEDSKEASKDDNPYLKVAIDSAAKECWKKYLGDYGADMAKEIKKKKLSDSAVKKADSGQMFKTVDSKAGNPPAEFKIDKQKGNPPAEWKFAQIFKDIEVFPAKKSYLVVAKSKRPIWLIALKDEKADMKQASLGVLKGIVTAGLNSTMKEYNATKIGEYQSTFKPSMVDEFHGDNREKGLRTTPTKGLNEDGFVDEGKPNLKGKPRNKGVDEDGVNTVKLSSAETTKRIKAMQDFMQLIDDETKAGTPQEELIPKVEAWIEEAKSSGEPVASPAMGVVGPTKGAPPASPGMTAEKKAGIEDRAMGDLKGHEKSEAKDPVTADGEHDLKKIKRDDQKGDEIWSAGKDDLNIPRKQVVDLKANKESKEAYEKKEVEINTQNKKDVSDKKWKAIQKASADRKAELDSIKTESAKEVSEFKKAFRQRMLSALTLASKRANLNIIDNPLKMHLADVLMEETDTYMGMDPALATELIETAFSLAGNSYIDHLLKEAETYIDMPEDSFLSIKEDANKLNLVIPVADTSPEGGGEEFPMSLGEGEEGFLGEESGPLEPAEDLMARASRSNPVFTPKSEGHGSKHDLLKGIFKK
jgi:hypothetical protein